MPEDKANVNQTKVVCPTKDAHKHNRWCFENRAVTTEDLALNQGNETYKRVFEDAETARFFRFDNRIQG